MKRINWIVVRNLLRFYTTYTVLMFGGIVITNHFLFQREMASSFMNEKVVISLLFGIFITIQYRSRWNKKDVDVRLFHTEILNSQESK